MARACPLPTPEERRYGAIQTGIQDALVGKVHAALREAAETARDEIAAAGLELPPPAEDYFTAVIHQMLFCKLCGADPETLTGGRPDTAVAIIRTCQNIARHHWGATIELAPRREP